VNPLVAGGVALAATAVVATSLSVTELLLRSERTSVTEHGGPVRSLVVDLDSGDVRVVAADRSDVVAERTDTWSLQRPTVREQVVDGELRVRAECAASLLWCDVSYVLRVPRGTPVQVRTGSGTLTLDGTGEVDADTGSGDVRLAAVEGDAEVRTGSGSITVDGVRGRSVTVRTGSGDITMTRAEVAVVDGRSGSGDTLPRVEAGPAAALVDAAVRHPVLLEPPGPPLQRLPPRNPQLGLGDLTNPRVVGRHPQVRPIEERHLRPRPPQLVPVKQVVRRNVILINRLLHQPQPQNPGVKLHVLHRVRGHRRNVVYAPKLHDKPPVSFRPTDVNSLELN